MRTDIIRKVTYFIVSLTVKVKFEMNIKIFAVDKWKILFKLKSSSVGYNNIELLYSY